MKKPIIIEIFILTTMLIVIFCAIIFTYSKIFVEPNIYTIRFKDIDGITHGSPVRMMGMNVGYVRKLKSGDKYVDVEIVLTKNDIKIPNGTVARVEFYGLGGSKSIELMPPDGSCDVGILTDTTIRINDVAKEAVGIVEIIESMEEYVKNFDKGKADKALHFVGEIKNTFFDNANKQIKDFSQNNEEKIELIKIKQKELKEKIEKINKTTEKFNEFIKK